MERMSLTSSVLAKHDEEKLERLTRRAEELSQLMGQVTKAMEQERSTERQAPAQPPPQAARRDPLSQSLPTYPASKKVLVDRYAEIALFDAEENQREIVAHGALEQRKKAVLRRALDDQVRTASEHPTAPRDQMTAAPVE